MPEFECQRLLSSFSALALLVTETRNDYVRFHGRPFSRDRDPLYAKAESQHISPRCS
jgi:hypothetical protein